MRRRLLTVISGLLLSLALPPLSSDGAEPGLPFTEDFITSDLRDPAGTTANWSTQEEAVLLAARHAQFGPFAPKIFSGSDVTSDANATRALAVGDVDGDGDPDLVEGNFVQRNRLYLNNRTPNPFSDITGLDISTELHNTYSVALGDVDGDGDLDLVTGNNSQPNRLYLNNGTADPFDDSVGAAIGVELDATNAVALGDMDGDGDLDLLVGNSGQGNRLYLNNGSADPFSGVFYVDVTADEYFTLSIALGDMDGDGDLDLVAGNLGQTNRLYLNNGTASPFEGVAGSDISSDTHSTRAVAVADMDGDGDLDVVAGNENQPNRLYLNNGTEAPFEGVSGVDITASQFKTNAVLPGDLDCDGDLDLVIVVSDNRNRFFLNNGTPTPFEGAAATSITTDSTQRSAGILADMDMDGDLDLVAGNFNSANRLYLNPSSGNPFIGVGGKDITSDSVRTQSVAVGDMDGDGDLDMVAGNILARNRLYLNNGTSDPFSGITGKDVTTDSHNTSSVALGDVDGDGDLDLVAGNVSQKNRLYLNNGTSDPFAGVSGSDITTDAHNTGAVALGDMNGDGALDLVVGNFFQQSRLYLNNGTSDPFAGVTGSDILTDSDSLFAVALGDVDGDGDLDLVMGDSSLRNRLFLNNGSADPFSGVTGSDITTEVRRTRSVALGDVDRDGDLDLVAGNFDQTNRLYLNNGTSEPFSGVTGSSVSSDAGATRFVTLGDVDNDGDLDLVAVNENQSNRLYLNNGSADPFAGITGDDITEDAYTSLSGALGDMDRDGDLDLVVGTGEQRNRLYLNGGKPKPAVGWQSNDIEAAAIPAEAMAIGDLDRDGDADVVMGLLDEPPRLYLNNGTCEPFRGVVGEDISTDIRPTQSVALGDLDGDGDLDLVTGNGSGSIASDLRNRLYLNNGTSHPFDGVTGQNISSDNQVTYSVALGDMDGDGDLDLVAGNGPTSFFSGVNRLYLNNGTSKPFEGVAGSDITSDTHDTSSTGLGDMDGDGDLDVVAATFNGRNRLYLNNGTSDPFAGVTGRDITTNTGTHRSVALGDLDDDGDLDLVVGKGGRERFYLNNGTVDPFADVTGKNLSSESDNTNSVALADVDCDGDLDFVEGNFLGAESRLFLNNGTEDPFEGVLPITVFSAPNTAEVALGDLDGDGALDIAVADSGGPTQFISRLLYDTAQSRATSLAVDGVSGDIPDAILTVTEDRPPNTSTDYWLSNNGGVNWRLAHPGSSMVFPTTGSDLRWRVELDSLSPILSPRVMQVNVDSSARPTPTETSSPTSTPSLTATPSNTFTATPTSTSAPTFTETSIPEPTSTFTPIPIPTPTTIITATATVTITATQTALDPSTTPSPTSTETPTNSPTVTDSPTLTFSLTTTPTLTPNGPGDYDIFPDTPDGKINAGDLLRWLERLQGEESQDRSMFFDFARFWQS